MLLAVTKASVPLYACAHCCEPTGALNRCTHEVVEEVPVLNPSNGAHGWHTADMNTGAVIWNFFSQYRL